MAKMAMLLTAHMYDSSYFSFVILDRNFTILQYLMHVLNPRITNRQRQIVIGTILGGSSIVETGKNCYLSMRDKREQWIKFKASELSCLASDNPFTSDTTNRWHSRAYPVFLEFRDMFYQGGKRHIVTETLELLTDVSFAIWFGDCGKYVGDCIVLNTHVWGKAGSEAIVKYFRRFGWKASLKMERNWHRVKLDASSSRKFMKIAGPHLPHTFF